MSPEIRVPAKSAIDDTIDNATRSPGILLSWKPIKKKQKAHVPKIVIKHTKFLLSYQMEKISETVPLSLITY